MDSSDPNHFPFLSLPPEIRNTIYRHALVHNDIITISPPASPAPDQAPLLQMNRQIRAEVGGLYYPQNRFVWIISSFDAAAFVKWAKSSEARRTARIGLKYHGPPRWTNLLLWLEDFCCSEVGTGIGGGSAGLRPWVKAGARIFRVADLLRMKGFTWNEINPTLEEMRVAIGQYDKRWLDDA